MIVPCARCSTPIPAVRSTTPGNEELDVCEPCREAISAEVDPGSDLVDGTPPGLLVTVGPA